MRLSPVARLPTARPWSWAPHTPSRPQAGFPPLRVLFCGSDAFSMPSWTMLRELQSRRSDVVSHLGLCVPAPARSGRGLQNLTQTPLAQLAKRMGMTPSYVDSFVMRPHHLPQAPRAKPDEVEESSDGESKWDLIIAVSFGHKIHADTLAATSHGGLNVHPSVLPQYRGPAPLHRALLAGDTTTGVSVQTLHPHVFDAGQVLARSAPVEITPTTSLSQLSVQTARIGAQLLRDVLLQGYPVNAPAQIPPPEGVVESHAPKIGKDDMQLRTGTAVMGNVAFRQEHQASWGHSRFS
ncbi:Methionyl-tRNA formyltransferase [Savitreella phatthalungensis]